MAGLADMDPVRLRIALGRAPGLSATHLLSAGVQLDTAAALLAAGNPNLPAGLAPPGAALAWLRHPDQALIEADCRWFERERVQLIDCFDARYPPLLTHIADAPALLYVRGDAGVLPGAQLAIVGSRNPTAAGRRNAADFSGSCANAGMIITSGLARGIDAAAHQGALAAGGRTVAVLGCGIDAVYPPQHRDLAALIAAAGALITEFPPGTAPRSQNFPRRNRIISGLSLGTLVVEATRRSGSLITARLAGEQGREVFAIPGSIHNPLAHGCHRLIQEGATLVESATDILCQLKININKQVDTKVSTPAGSAVAQQAPLDKGYKILLDALGFEPTGIDDLVDRTGLPSQSVASMLLILELSGRVGMHAGGRYLRLD